MIEFRDIGLDVKERRSVEDVHILDIQGAFADLHKTDDGKPDGIGPFRCSCGKKSSRFRVKKRSDGELLAAALMEAVKKNEMGEPIKVLQSI